MAHLSQITKETRLFSKIGGIVFVVFLLLFFSFKGYGLIQRMFFPTPPPGPEMGYGKLQQIQFPQTTAIVPATYTVNTIDGTLPIGPDRLNVYVVSTPSANLLAFKNAQENVERAGFTSEETKISDTVYRWTNSINATTITYDIVTNNFNVEGNLFNTSADSSLISARDQVLGASNGFLSRIGADTSDINLEKTQVIFLKNSGGEIVGVEESTDANLARVNYYQKSLGEVTIGGSNKPLEIYYPYPDRTLLSFVVGPTTTELSVLQGEFINRKVVSENYSTYPIITTQQAFENLQKGNGYIVVNPNNQESVDISDVTMGYYIGSDFGRNTLGQELKHIQPIYVFLGLNGFIGYVPAVAPAALCDPATGC